MLHWVLHSTTGTLQYVTLGTTLNHRPLQYVALGTTLNQRPLQYVTLDTTLHHRHTPVCYTGYYTQPWAHSSMLHWVLHSTTGTLHYVMVLHSTRGTLQYVTLGTTLNHRNTPVCYGTTLHHRHTAVCYTGYYTPPWAHCSMLHWVLHSTLGTLQYVTLGTKLHQYSTTLQYATLTGLTRGCEPG